MKIPFDKTYLTGNEKAYLDQVLAWENSLATANLRKRAKIIENKYHFRKTLLTTSCTDALEMAALLHEAAAWR